MFYLLQEKKYWFSRLNIIITGTLALIFLVFAGRAVAQSERAEANNSNAFEQYRIHPVRLAKVDGTRNIQQKNTRRSRCRKIKRYRRTCRTRQVRVRRCRNYRTVSRRCKKVPVRRRHCTVHQRKVRRCRGPLGQEHCRVITRPHRVCKFKTYHVTRCRKTHKTVRRCHHTYKPRRICRKKVYYIRRCSTTARH